MNKGIRAPSLIATSVGVLFLSASLAAVAQPASEGFSPDRLARIGAVMRAEIDKGTLPGVVTLIARHGKIVHFEAQGYLDEAKTKSMPQDAVFRMFSMTKPFVSVVAMMLVEQGRMNLSDPITTWLPEFKDLKVLIEKKDAAGNVTHEQVPAERQITVQYLLRHTSGFTSDDNSPFTEINEAYIAADIGSRETDVSPDELVRRLAGIPLSWQPGTRWHYGMSTDVLGVLLERLTGKRLDLLLDEMLFNPLGMKDTSFQVKPEQMVRLADAFDADSLKAQGWKASRVEADPGKRYRRGGSGSVSTAVDYFRFVQMVLNGGVLDGVRLLSRKTVECMLSDHIPGFPGPPTGTGPGYGFGLGGTTFTIDPKEQIIGVFMAQAPTPRLRTRFLFKNLLYGALVE